MILWRCFVTANGPLIYADACVFLEVLQQTHGRWRDSLKVLLAAERGDIQLLASRLLAVEVGRFRGDANKLKVDELVVKYLESVDAQWAEVDLLIARQARELSWQFSIKSGADAIHLATAVRFRADYFMSRDGGFPYGQTVGSTFVTTPKVVWTPSLFDAEVDSEPEPVSNHNSSDSRTGSLPPQELLSMVSSFNPESFYESAREFARTALEAHHAGNYRRVPLDAGTALEHLAKACLARRSPALLAELKGESSVSSLVWLLGIEGAKVAAKVRTVGLWDALARTELFVTSPSVREDLRTLVDMRNGIVHAAENMEVEERILAAFAQHADAILKDLGRDRGEFWGGQLAVVDALLSDVSDKIAHHVEVKLAAAKASYEREYRDLDATMVAILKAARSTARPLTITPEQQQVECPACGSAGVAAGMHEVWWATPERKQGTQPTPSNPTVLFDADRFECPVCGLRLDSPAEMDLAGVETVWEIKDADWRDYEEDPDLEAYETRRDE